MTHSNRFNPWLMRGAFYVLQFSIVLGLLFAVWYLDPFGWRKTAPSTAPQSTTTYSTLTQIENLQSRVARDPQNAKLLVDLATLYLQYVRETGDPSYYNKADQLLKQVLAADSKNFFALLDMGYLSLARHDFRAALDWGRKAEAVNDRDWLVYGVIGDANVELGNYPEAEKSMDKMVSLRPDITSYSRISYMRELLGDIPGAIQAMSLAARAGVQNSEANNWARVQLGNLYFNTGKLDQAETLYKTALTFYPGYIHALAGMGRVYAARGDYPNAIKYYQQALRQIPIPEYVILLGDVYATSGDKASAQKQYALIGAIQQLFAANGVNNDMELALFNADHGIDPVGTLARARAAYQLRSSVYGADVLAWALYQAGNYAEAKTYSDLALRLGTKDALKEYHAGMIALKLGDRAAAKTHLTRALEINPYFSLLYSAPAKQTLQQLQ